MTAKHLFFFFFNKNVVAITRPAHIFNFTNIKMFANLLKRRKLFFVCDVSWNTQVIESTGGRQRLYDSLSLNLFQCVIYIACSFFFLTRSSERHCWNAIG